MYLQDESEVRVVLYFLVANLDVLALFDGEPSKQRVQHWINILTYVF